MDDKSQKNAPNSFIHRFIRGSGDRITLLLLHGTGGNENSLIELGEELLPNANLLSPRGKVLENGMPRFFRRHSAGVFDEDDLHKRTAELADFIEEAAAAYGLDRRAIVAVGYSNGANIGASLLLSRPDVLAGAVLLRPQIPFEPTVLPSLAQIPVLLISGDRDPLVPHAKVDRLAELFQASGADVTHKTVHAGHALTEPELNSVRDFLSGVLKKA